MEAVRTKVRAKGRKVTVDLPESFEDKDLEVIVLQSADEDDSTQKISLEKWREKVFDFYSNFNVDMTGYKFNRDELYDRP